MNAARHVVVVGGGLAGLAAAHRLRTQGLGVTLLESADRVGGQVLSRREGDWLTEAGAVSVPGPTPAVEAMLVAAGLPPEDRVVLDRSQVRRFLVHRGRPVPVPSSAAEMVASPLLTVAGRLRLLKEPFVARGAPDPEESVLDFASRRFGAEMATRFIDPVVSGASAGDPAALLASAALPQLVELERRSGSILKGRMHAARRARREGKRQVSIPSWSCPGGLETLPRRLGASLGEALRLGVAAERLERGEVGWLVHPVGGAAIPCDAVVLAVPAPAVAALAGTVGAGPLPALAATPHASVATVSLGFRREQVGHPLDGHGVLTAIAEGGPLRSVVFLSSILPDRVPAGHVLLGAMLGGVRHPALLDNDDAELAALAQHQLTALLEITGAPAIITVDRWPGAIPQAVVGHGRALAEVAAVEAAAPTIACCGAWRDGIGLGRVMQGGIAAADRVVAGLTASPGGDGPR